jgi:hypothetical protein
VAVIQGWDECRVAQSPGRTIALKAILYPGMTLVETIPALAVCIGTVSMTPITRRIAQAAYHAIAGYHAREIDTTEMGSAENGAYVAGHPSYILQRVRQLAALGVHVHAAQRCRRDRGKSDLHARNSAENPDRAAFLRGNSGEIFERLLRLHPHRQGRVNLIE